MLANKSDKYGAKNEKEKKIMLVPMIIGTNLEEKTERKTPPELKIEEYFNQLDKERPGEFGIDANGIYYLNRFVMTFYGEEKINEREVNKRINAFSTLFDTLDVLNNAGKPELVRCDCNSNLVLIKADGIHDLMTGSEGTRRTSSGVSQAPGSDNTDQLVVVTDSGSESTRRTKSGVSGGGRDYLTWIEEEEDAGELVFKKFWEKLDKNQLNFSDVGKIVAVIDTGLDLFLSNKCNDNSFKLWENKKGNCGGKDDLVGYNFVSGNANVFDDHGHGTSVASVLAETFGWYRDYQLMVLKAFDKTGHADSYQQACAIYYAIEHGADVIIASWGGLHFDPNVYLALEKANEKGIEVFAAAGNFAFNISNPDTRFYPAVHGAYSLTGFYERIDELEHVHPVAGLSKDENDLWEDSDVYPGVLAASGELVSTIEPSYNSKVDPVSPVEQFGFLSDMSKKLKIRGVTLAYRLKRKSGTSFSAPKVAGLYMRNGNHIPLGFKIKVNWDNEEVTVRKIE